MYEQILTYYIKKPIKVPSVFLISSKLDHVTAGN